MSARQGVTRNSSIFQHCTHLAFGIIAQAMWRRKIRSHCRSGRTLNDRGVEPSTGSSRAHTNVTSPWGWISPELPISVEVSLSIHASSVLQHSPLTTQLVFTDFCNLLHTHPCFCKHRKRKECDSFVSYRRVPTQQKFKGIIKWPDNSLHIKCPRVSKKPMWG